MNVIINQQATTLPAHATVQDALATLAARPPFAVAVNTRFVPNTQYASHTLHEGDRIEVIAPVTGG
jgi:sulfur carrier protein